MTRTARVHDIAPVESASAAVARRYDRIAFLYDLYDAPMERLGGERRRRRLLARARGRVLEVGIGTGVNLELYPDGVLLTGIDISSRMLARAASRAAALGMTPELVLGDIERLPFPDRSFDTVVATCVFCSVAHPVAGLRELARVVREDGQILLVEHVRPDNPVLGLLTDVLSPLTRRLMGPELNRRTEENVVAAGIRLVSVRREAVWREMAGTA